LFAVSVSCLGVTSAIDARADEVRVAVPQALQTEEFVALFKADPAPSSQRLRLSIKPFSNSLHALKALKAGETQLAIFTVDALMEAQRESKSALMITPALVQPFVFESSQELFDILDTSFGQAVLADISRTEIVPLTLWNRGLSHIMAEPSIKKLNDFAGVRVASQSSDAVFVLSSLGAKASLVPDYEPIGMLADNKIDAIEVAPEDIFRGPKARSLVGAFRPLINVLAANSTFWGQLSEAQKQALAAAATGAAKKAQASVRSIEESIRAKAGLKNLTYLEFEGEQLKKLQSLSKKAFFKNRDLSDAEWQFASLKDARAEAQQGSKKRLK
jgi:TRAP-type C4-dicarboxylate transport system substrate-binding protein